MSNIKYTAIMIDIVDSRKYDNRNEIQEYMKSIIIYLNKIFHKSLKKPLVFSAGDEVQGLFINPLSAYLCVRFCMIICFPVKIRVGLGYGELSFDNDEWDSSELDGEVYHNARYAIESFSGKNSFGIRMNTKTRKDKYLNAMFYSSQLIQKEQSINAQNVKLIAELIFPLYDDKNMDPYLDFKEDFISILEKRNSVFMSDKKARNNSKIGKMQDKMEKGEIDIIMTYFHQYNKTIYNILENSDLLVNNVWKKGMSTCISEVLGTTRQNIDQHIRLGKIEENRYIDFSIAGWLIEEFDYE